MTNHPLPEGTWIRSKVAVSDSGDFNDRYAPAGALGKIVGASTKDGSAYDVVFWPTFVSNFWDAREIDADAEILPAGHPDIPSDERFDLASAVADIVADGDVDEQARTVTAPASVGDRIRKAAPTFGDPTATRAILEAVDGMGDGREVVMDFERFDALAKLVGVGDRLDGRDDPFAPAA